jgi:phosphoribosylformimino-5-aminoimidazole carboxamide ribotide isomerase
MLVIPAIDIRGGKGVRLLQGDYQRETIYFEDPVMLAKLWRISNAKVLHIVDLDAARGGSPDRSGNRDVIREIVDAVDIPIQVGGGMRTLGDIEFMLGLGVYRIVIGTAAVRNPEIVTEAVKRFSASRIVAGIDAHDGEVKVDGWQEGSGIDAVELALEMEARGCSRVLYTDISRDGTLEGPNVEAYQILASKLTSMRITASGGVGGYQDLIRLSEIGSPVDSVIVGKALYENKFPCQNCWCWHDLSAVDLDCFSTAELRSNAKQ